MYLQIMEQIRRRIAVGDWQPGHELPSIRALAAAVQVSVITVKRAYLELERDGVIVTRQGKGSFVADSADLGTQLRRDELDEHLSAAADIGRAARIDAERDRSRGCAEIAGSEGRDSASMTEPVIELEGVDKAYRFFQLTDVRLRLEAGQIMGFVGPNGAGKSTTIRILMAMIRQDRGTVRVLGHAMPREQAAAKRDIGFVSEDMRLYGARDARLAHALRRLDLSRLGSGLRRRPAAALQPARRADDQGLSHGERVKATLLLVLARRPRLLLLDEPTTGLDPVARHEILAELMDVVRDERRAILFSSHNTQDVEQISDHITFIDRGRIIDSSDKETFLDRWRRLHLEVPSRRDAAAFLQASSTRPRAAGSRSPRPRPTRRTSRPSTQRAGVTVRDVQRMTLEEIFVANVMSNRREKGA